jgi:hypothetical protein
VNATRRCGGGGGEHAEHRGTQRTPVNPMVRLVLCNNGERNVDLDPKF